MSQVASHEQLNPKYADIKSTMTHQNITFFIKIYEFQIFIAVVGNQHEKCLLNGYKLAQ